MPFPSTLVAAEPEVQVVGLKTPGDRRLLSLDVFRGATIASMMLVNNPGTSSAVYPALRHSAWHGWTFSLASGVSPVNAIAKVEKFDVQVEGDEVRISLE